jgi:hypothetical protein
MGENSQTSKPAAQASRARGTPVSATGGPPAVPRIEKTEPFTERVGQLTPVTIVAAIKQLADMLHSFKLTKLPPEEEIWRGFCAASASKAREGIWEQTVFLLTRNCSFLYILFLEEPYCLSGWMQR